MQYLNSTRWRVAVVGWGLCIALIVSASFVNGRLDPVLFAKYFTVFVVSSVVSVRIASRHKSESKRTK